MLYICIPVHNEAPTIGVLLWRIRAAFQDFSRDYELVVYDDGSTDATAEVLEPYAKVLPLTVLSSSTRRGYGAALDALVRYVATHTRYPRRDAMILMQGDFTDRPEHIQELVKRFEGGADVVATERRSAPTDPQPTRRLLRAASWVLRPFVRVPGVSDPTSTYRLMRIQPLRDLLRERGDRRIVAESSSAANAELLIALAPHARRIESVPVDSRFDVRQRESRNKPFSEAVALARFGWRNRRPGRRVALPPAEQPVPREMPPESSSRPSRDETLALTTATDGLAPRRRNRPRRDEPRTEASARPPRAPKTARELPPAPAVDEPVALESESGDAPLAKRRRKRSRRGRSKDAAAEMPSTEMVSDTAPDVGSDTASDSPLDTAAPARRKRRGRKRRAGARPTADGGDESASENVDASSTNDDGAESSAPADGEAPRKRRSRRGRRRGARTGGDSAASDTSLGADPAPPADA